MQPILLLLVYMSRYVTFTSLVKMHHFGISYDPLVLCGEKCCWDDITIPDVWKTYNLVRE